MLRIKRDDEKRQPQREGDQRLRAVEFEVAGQLTDDLDGDGRDRLERIERQIGGDAGGEHDDHRFADGAGGGEENRADDPGQRCRQNDLLDGLGLRRAETIGAFPQRARDRADDVVGQGRHIGDDHDPHDDPGRQHAIGGNIETDAAPISRRNGPKVTSANRP